MTCRFFELARERSIVLVRDGLLRIGVESNICPVLYPNILENHGSNEEVKVV